MCAQDDPITERPERQGFITPRVRVMLDDIRADLDDRGVSTVHLTDAELYQVIMAVWFMAYRFHPGQDVTPEAITRAIRLMAAVNAAERVA